MNRQVLISYASAFVSFLLRQPEIKSDIIRSVYLFGSVARGDFDSESDVDIYVDAEEKYEPLIKKIIQKSLKNFYSSDEAEKFRLLGVKNELSVKYGNVQKWELFSSIKSEAVLLFSVSSSPSMKKYFLIKIKPIKDIAKRNKIIRKMAGRNEKNRKEHGIVEEFGGSVIDSRHYIIPAEKLNDILRIFSKEKTLYELKEIWM